MSLVVLRVKGRVGIDREAEKTLKDLHLHKKFSATILPDNPSVRGMLRKVKNTVSWCKLDEETAKLLLENRASIIGGEKIDETLLSAWGFGSLEALSKALVEGRTRLSSLKGLKPFFSLAPPCGGFKGSTKKSFKEGGVLGENPLLPEIIKKMIKSNFDQSK